MQHKLLGSRVGFDAACLSTNAETRYENRHEFEKKTLPWVISRALVWVSFHLFIK